MLQYGITHLAHVAFPLQNKTYVVDFFLSDHRLLIECWQSSSRSGLALNWIEKNAAYVDLKFKRIKLAYPGVRTLALVEAGHSRPEQVREYASPALEHADALCCSMEEFCVELRRLCGVGGANR